MFKNLLISKRIVCQQSKNMFAETDCSQKPHIDFAINCKEAEQSIIGKFQWTSTSLYVNNPFSYIGRTIRYRLYIIAININIITIIDFLEKLREKKLTTLLII